jgi:hypothetical protein
MADLTLAEMLMKRGSPFTMKDIQNYWSGVKGRIGELTSDPVSFLGNAVHDVVPTADEMGGWWQNQDMNDPIGQKLQNLALAGITVYHGSPHKFDKFDSSKIGTGEGAQAYGHGLYFAEDPKVAMSYADKLGKTSVPVTTKYRDFDAMQSTNVNERGAAAILAKFDGDFSKANQYATKDADVMSVLDDWQRNGVTAISKQKSFYKVDIPDEHVAKMLDWDKTLSQQSEHVRGAIAKMMAGDDPILNELFADGIPATYLGAFDKSKGGQIYNTLAEQFGGHAGLSEKLRSVGIPGIRYLDGGSRGAGQGTSNYVLFDAEHAKILGRE